MITAYPNNLPAQMIKPQIRGWEIILPYNETALVSLSGKHKTQMGGKNLYAITSVILVLFFLSIFLFSKRTLEPSISFHGDLFPLTVLVKSPESDFDLGYVPLSPSTNATISLITTQTSEKPEIESFENVNPPTEDSITWTSAKNESGLASEFEKPHICNFYMGSWVRDEEYPIYRPGSCPYVDEAYDCQTNGRQDSSYLKWRWKPVACDLPRYLLLQSFYSSNPIWSLIRL